ncbi:MAG: hypothetical protein ABIR96_01160 [Bdellovibrionota bacterium]
MKTSKLDEKIGGTPEAKTPRLYRNAETGYTIADVEGPRVFHVEGAESDDDEQLNSARLTRAGVDEPFDDVDHPETQTEEDREFVLDQQAYSTKTRHDHLDDEQGVDDDVDLIDDDEELALTDADEDDDDVSGADEER